MSLITEEIKITHHPFAMDLYLSEISVNTDTFSFIAHSKILEQGILAGFAWKRDYYDAQGNFSLNGPIQPDEININPAFIPPNTIEIYPPEFSANFDVFYLYPSDLITGAAVADINSSGAFLHLAILSGTDFYEQYKFFNIKNIFQIHSVKETIKVYIPRYGGYWGIYLICKENPDFHFSTSRYCPFIVVQQIDATYYNDEKNKAKFGIEYIDNNTYWYTKTDILRIGLLKQTWNDFLQQYEYELILDERDELIFPIRDFDSILKNLRNEIIKKIRIPKPIEEVTP